MNLVPNPSFELFYSCNPTGEIDSAKFWHNPTGYSPDYYNSCISPCSTNCFDVPNNSYGIQNARTGNAYAGIITGGIGCDCREYIQAQLTDSLQAGSVYCVSFFVCLTDSSNFATNNIGVYFSNGQVSSSNIFYLPYSPQIDNDPIQNPLTAKNQWIEVSAFFTANGGEKFITIGNFKADINTDTVNLVDGSPSLWYSYYYIDDISVVNCDSLSGIFSHDGLSLIVLFPNPANDLFKVEYEHYKVSKFQFCDLLGHDCSELVSLNDNIFHLDCLSNGVYYVYLTFSNDHFAIEKLIINH